MNEMREPLTVCRECRTRDGYSAEGEKRNIAGGRANREMGDNVNTKGNESETRFPPHPGIQACFITTLFISKPKRPFSTITSIPPCMISAI